MRKRHKQKMINIRLRQVFFYKNTIFPDYYAAILLTSFFGSPPSTTDSNLMLKFGETDCLTLQCNLLLIDFCIILQLLPATEDLPSAQGGSLTETSVIIPVEIFQANVSWGSGFPRLELSLLQRYAN